MVSGPAAALRDVEKLEGDDRLSRYRYLPAIKGDLLRRLDRRPEAVVAYRQALALADNEAERAFLIRRISRVRWVRLRYLSGQGVHMLRPQL